MLNSILEENERRLKILRAEYDPVTGEGLEEHLGEKRVKLSIKDFAIPVQWVPAEMMNNKLIKAVARAGSIEKYIKTKKWKGEAPSFSEIERRIRRIRHKHDFCFWAFWCIWINSKTAGKIRFKLNRPQLRVLALCEKLRKEGVPIDIIILKARQWGGSTFCIFYQAWVALKWDEFHNFTVAAQVAGTSETILAMLKDAFSRYPAWDLGLADDVQIELGRRGTTNNAYVIKDSAHNKLRDTVIYIGSAEKPDSLRGDAVRGAHYSEIGVWPDTPEKRPEDLIADISGGIPKIANSMQVMESTAKSSDDFFADVWGLAMAGESSFNPIFIPWYDIPHDTMPIKDKKQFVKWLLDHKDDNTKVKGWKNTGQHYWWLWTLGATLEGINWYRNKEKDFTNYSQMANEAPSIAEEAFQSSGMKVFDFYEVQAMKAKCKEPRLEGDLVSNGTEGEDVITNIKFIPKRGGVVKIYEEPDDSPIAHRYVTVVDIGGSRPTSDFSSVRVFDRLMMMQEFGGLNGKPSVVAEMHYHAANHKTLVNDAMRLSAYYNNALLVIESNTLETSNKERDVEGGGAEYILDIASGIYPNLYMRQSKEENVDEKTERKWGFHTNTSTKPKIIHHMQTCVHEQLWHEPSKDCCAEMSQYIQHDGNRFDAPPKKHDDILMATAIGLWICLRELPEPQWIKQQTETRSSVRSYNNAATL